jgi:general secretion pathway protein C
MGRTLSWTANTGLFVLCCFLVANTANSVFAALLTPTVAAVAAEPAAAAPAGRSWENTQVILTRNLFNASILAPAAAPPPVNASLEDTRLPLELRGTAAASNPLHSWAAVEDKQSREVEVVQVGSRLKNRNAEVVRIERRLIVLSENGEHRKLTLDDDPLPGSPTATSSRSRSRSSARSSRSSRTTRTSSRRAARTRETEDLGKNLRQLAEDRFSVPRADVEKLVRNPGALLSQATMIPKFEQDQMVGLELRAIKPGSLFERIGLKNNDVIVEFNGQPIHSTQDTAKILAEFSQADEVDVVLQSGRSLHFVYE